MHETEHPLVKGYIDTTRILKDSKRITGWCVHESFEARPIRVKRAADQTVYDVNINQRPDVCRFYQRTHPTECGWEVVLPFVAFPCDLQMCLDDDSWVTVFQFQHTVPPQVEFQNTVPSYLVVDNFYKDPDTIRRFALSCEFQHHPKNHKGQRTDECYRFKGLKERFEQILGRRIRNWENYGTNGCFQYCVGGDQLVYHTDTQQYAGVLFLTPDAPVQTGTSLFRSKYTNRMKVLLEDHDKVFVGGFLDPTQFERVDTVGNIYNRLVLFDAQILHAATEYFGNSKDNGRLFQLFFFDLDQ